MMNIDKAIDGILRREGGLTAHPSDRGGLTNWGITLATLSLWLERQATTDELKNLQREQAKEIYRFQYYETSGIALLPEVIQGQVLDIAVHSGHPRAFRLLQETINQQGLGPISEDGKLGEQTLRAAHNATAVWGGLLNDALADRRILFFIRLAVGDPSQLVFLKGWANRAMEFKTYSMRA